LILNQVLFEITGRHRKQSHCETWSRYLKNQENWPQWRHNYWRHAEWREAQKKALEVVLDRLGLKDYPLDKAFNYALAHKVNAELNRKGRGTRW